SPATRGTTATKTAASTAKAASSESTSTEAAATAHAAQQRAKQKRAASTATSAATAAYNEDCHQHQKECQHPEATWLLGAHRQHRAHSRAFQRIATEHLDHRFGAFDDAAGEVALLERRYDDAADDHCRLRIGQPSFEPVAHFDANPAVIPGDDQQRPVVLALLANSPFTPQLQTEFL